MSSRLHFAALHLLACGLSTLATLSAHCERAEKGTRRELASSTTAPASAAVSPGECPSDMAAVPGGTLPSADGKRNTLVKTFCMDTTEVTVDAYSSCVRVGKCQADHAGQSTTDGEGFLVDRFCNYGKEGRGNHPMNCVDWWQATAYCEAQGKRLATADEWEWAARGGNEGRLYPWGDSPPGVQLCWSGIQERRGSCPVGLFPQGDAAGGIHDMAGNVYEWTSSPFGDGVERQSSGGSWHLTVASLFLVQRRGGNVPRARNGIQGFRCARYP